MQKMSNSGFSLLALLVTMMGVALVGTSYYLSTVTLSTGRELEVTLTRLKKLESASRKYLNTTGRVPSPLTQLLTDSAGLPSCAVDANPDSVLYRQQFGWCGPYIELPPFSADQDSFYKDGWGNDFDISLTTLRSRGPNEALGDADDITETY